MKSFIFCILMFCSFAWAQAPRTNIQFGDDTWVQVPLQFPFPLYGATFTNSFMFSNGVVGFFGINQNPTTSFCCSGENLSSNSWTGFNYSIMPLWTDLYPVNASSFYVEGDSTHQKYQWNNIAEISNNNNLNTFGVTIQPSGLINFNYDNINIQNQFVTSAVTGNLANGEFMQFHHGIGMNNNTLPSLNFSVTPQYNDPCTSNPLYSPSCPGYQMAYHDQQCSINTLYATTCPGYQQAYYDQQCSANPLYDSGCSGYQAAYFDQQCSLDPLYNNQCVGYQAAYFDQQCSLDPLYNNQCVGYETAYFDQQCSTNPLYNNQCVGYDAAYFNQQCTLDVFYNESCIGYTAAYYSLQCSINTLYDSGCPGYQQAYFDQQCSLDSLYNTQCPGYATAFFNQQCSLDGLYDRQCSNYAEAYAKQNLLNSPVSVTTVATVSTTEPSVQVSDDGKVTTDVPLVSDPVVNTIVTKKTETKKEENKEETKPVTEKKTESKSQAKRESPKVNPVNPATRTASEKEFEKEITNQNQAIVAIGLSPGFSAYQNAIVPDLMGAQMQRQYNKPNVDNARVQRQLNAASDRLHNEMINEQYR